jgi:hypothetical protein
LAQGILESQAGQSQLCQQSNNHFGIKCKDEWTGPYVLHDDDKKNECFRVYPDAAASFKDHSDFLKNRPYYTNLFTLAPDDYKAWATGLKKDGYATERNYPQMLVKIIEDNNLQQYTILAMEKMKHPGRDIYAGNDNNEAVKDNKEVLPVDAVTEDNKSSNSGNIAGGEAVAEQNTQPVAVNHAEEEDNNDEGINTDTYPGGTFAINGTKVLYAKKGTSLLALASTHKISYKSLLDFNEIGGSDILNKDRLIYLEKKPKKGAKDFHVVSSSETIEDIAQKEGVRLESLMEYNALPKGSQPAAGTKIYLRAVQGASLKAHKA